MTSQDVAERIRQVLTYVPMERLSLVPDGRFSQTARRACRTRPQAMAAGPRLVPEELGLSRASAPP